MKGGREMRSKEKKVRGGGREMGWRIRTGE